MRFLPVGMLAAATALIAGPAVGPVTAQESPAPDYAASTGGTRVFTGDVGFAIKMLVEASNLGSAEVEVGEITIPAHNLPERPHFHTSIEIFYILEGVLEHVVDGETHVLEPGMVGIVRPTDDVLHRVPGDVPVRALVIWTPGGEADRIAPFFQETPIGGGHGGG